MLRRTNDFHLPRSVRAGDYTAAAAHAFLCIDIGFFLARHRIFFYQGRFELASLLAFAASLAFSPVYRGLKSTLGQTFPNGIFALP
jgi:hypothetical protein